MPGEALVTPEPESANGEWSTSVTGAGLIVQVTWLCPKCGQNVVAPAWVLLDLAQRPDLWLTARATVACPACLAQAPQQPSLILTGTRSGIALLVAREATSAPPHVMRTCSLGHPLPDGFEGLRPHAPMVWVSSPTDAESILNAGKLPPPHAKALKEALAIRRLQSALVAAISARTAHELEAAVEAHPELHGHAVLKEWREHGIHDDPEDRTPAQKAMDQLPETLLDDLSQMAAEKAWQRYIKRMEVAQRGLLEELDMQVADLVAVHDRGEASRALADRCEQLAESIIRELEPRLAGMLWFIRAVMLISPLMAAPDDIEDAIDALEHAISLFEAANDPGSAAEARSNLVIALHTRPREREANLERGIALLEELVDFFESLPDPDRAALVRTNLAVALLDRKAGDPLENARRALEECQAALTHRSRERNAVDYAFTLTNKALAHSRLAEVDDIHLIAAERAYEEALEVLPPDADAALLGRIFFNYTDLIVITARRQPKARATFLARAEACARRAVEVHQQHGHAQELAFARRQLARILLSSTQPSDALPSNLSEARDLLFESLKVLTPEHYPADCIVTADEATYVCQRIDDWQKASLASVTALAAWLASGGDTVGREDLPVPAGEDDPFHAEAAHDSRFRFTAYTFFRAAQQHLAQGAAITDPEVQTALEHAVGIMEAGRATTLRAASGADVQELQRLRSIDPGLAKAYLAAVDKARSAAHEHVPTPPHGVTGTTCTSHKEQIAASKAGPTPSAEELLATIRGLPGMSEFARGQPPSLADIRTALRPSEAVIYLIAHPVGCCALVITPLGAPVPIVPIDLPATNSGRLFTLIFGFGMRAGSSPDGPAAGSPRAGQALLMGSQGFHPARFRRVLSKVLAEVGRTVARPLAHGLRDAGVTDAVVVPCGLLPVFAWHAATWRHRGSVTSLSDTVNTLSYAPSAGAWLAARKRAARLSGRPPFLVGLANPSRSQPPLPGAEAELRHVGTSFPDDRRALAYGPEATGSFLLAQLVHATHLHLGCHGTMRYDSVDGASLTLADDDLDIARIRHLMGDELRLVVVAACVSGAVNIILQPEESHALTIGFMHAGAAGVLGALWPIPDLPTTLFITRFYEELTNGPGTEPPVALARTQRWMRTLSPADVRRYVAERPALAALRGRGRLRALVPVRAGHRGRLRGMLTALHRRPFASPIFWAAFVLNGC
ncbi:CHAT domain-containing protein [Streptomyces sp. NPDC052727]|uniref:CHAT domain-containing protein n=1 Tax=Streptomyces sp. NPDC052727 TaxID=3154854 RepID=UPI003423B9F8